MSLAGKAHPHVGAALGRLLASCDGRSWAFDQRNMCFGGCPEFFRRGPNANASP